MWEYKARATNVVDGDTFDTLVDVGFGIAVAMRIRLYGVDTPERADKEAWTAAKDFTYAWLTGYNTFLLQTIKNRRETDTKDSFGRYLGICWDWERNITLNDALILNGHAVPYSR